MIKVKTFTTQLKIFHARQEIEDLDRAVNEFLAAGGIRDVVSVNDAITTGEKGEAIGIVRVVAYADPASMAKARYLRRMDALLEEWGDEIEKARGTADRLGAAAKAKAAAQLEELKARRADVSRKLDEVARAGGGAWEDIRQAADAAAEELRKGIAGAAAKLKRK